MPSSDVAKRSPFYERMRARWPLVDALLGGTEAMRRGRTEWLPKHPEETHAGYERRIKNGFLLEAFADAIERVVSKPFSRDAVVKASLPEMLEPIIDNADQRGRNLTQFARDVFDDGVSYGLSHILVDFPQVGTGMNLGMQRRLRLHPYFTHVKHDALIGGRWELLPTGQTRLAQIKLVESSVEPDGPYSEKETERIRVINAPTLAENGEPGAPGTWELWRKADESEEDWVKEAEGTHTFPGIPLVTFYADRCGVLEANIPFRKLAWLNLAHWQSSTDQRNILSVARVGILFASGFTAKEIDGGITIGPNNYIFSTNPEAKMVYVEHSGAAIGAGRQDLEDLKADMAAVSLQPITQQPGRQTATARAMDESKNESVAQAWVRGLENALLDAFRAAAAWVNLELPDDVSVDVHNDFGLTQRAIEDLKALGEAYDRGSITARTYLGELQRRGVISEDLDIEQELEDVKKEPPRIPFVGEPPVDDEGIDDDGENEEGDDA